MRRVCFAPSFRRSATITLRALEVRPETALRNYLYCNMILQLSQKEEVKSAPAG